MFINLDVVLIVFSNKPSPCDWGSLASFAFFACFGFRHVFNIELSRLHSTNATIDRMVIYPLLNTLERRGLKRLAK